MVTYIYRRGEADFNRLVNVVRVNNPHSLVVALPDGSEAEFALDSGQPVDPAVAWFIPAGSLQNILSHLILRAVEGDIGGP